MITSLAIGSINDISRLGTGVPEDIISAIKRKIVLLDSDQTKFIFQEPEKKTIRIQGLSGTGKTELLLHRIKELYVNDRESRIALTCHSKILAYELRKRIPTFFNFMKVEEQIDWQERLFCAGAWGSASDIGSGLYRYICAFYEIPFMNLRAANFDFGYACREAIRNLSSSPKFGKEYPFDYIFVDESQDFTHDFSTLCELVTRKTVYIAGDVFQDIFERNISGENIDFLLKKCYRTDPATLTVSHAFGMGLIGDSPIIRWLDDEQWAACGYTINRAGSRFQVGRDPVRRFSGTIHDSILPMTIHSLDDSNHEAVTNVVCEIIKSIYTQFPNVTVNDISILCPLDNSKFYELADYMSFTINRTLGIRINKAYESKELRSGQLFLSNRNNVKGLEFPFVICLASQMKRSLNYRNCLYMMLTRSLVATHLILFEKSGENETSNRLRNAVSCYQTNGYIEFQEPSPNEKADAERSLLDPKIQVSHREFVESIAASMSLGSDLDHIVQTVCKFRPNNFDSDEIKDLIETLVSQ